MKEAVFPVFPVLCLPKACSETNLENWKKLLFHLRKQFFQFCHLNFFTKLGRQTSEFGQHVHMKHLLIDRRVTPDMKNKFDSTRRFVKRKSYLKKEDAVSKKGCMKTRTFRKVLLCIKKRKNCKLLKRKGRTSSFSRLIEPIFHICSIKTVFA